MAGYIGSKASVVSSGAERKKVFAITTTTTSLTGLSYTPTKVHVYHNGIRLVDGTDYTATNGTSITLTNAAESGDEVVVVSYATFQVADAYTQAEADAEFVQVTGDTMTGDLSFGDNDKAIFGSGSDLQIYHSGAQSVIADVGTGQLTLSTNGTDIRLADSSGNRMLIAKPSAEVELYHNGSPKLATTNAGVDVTGTITATSFSGDGSALTGVGGSTAYGAVGTYMFAKRTAAGQSITSNTTIAGSGLRPTGIVNLRLGISTEIRNSRRDQATLSGTWRAMGDAERYTTSSLYTVGTLLVRIS